jgi:hypothetical protein
VKISDTHLAGTLAALLDSDGTVVLVPKSGEPAYRMDIGVQVHDNHRGDSPDVVLELAITILHPKLPKMRLFIPIPIEGERAGIGAAKEDLHKFAEREHFPIHLPMLVIGGDGNPAHAVDHVTLKTNVSIDMIPYGRLTQ